MKLLCDSACDLTREQMDALGVDAVHIEVVINDVEYKDNLTIKPVDLYEKMREGTLVKTSQISVGEFIETFKTYAKEGGEYLYLAFSSELSGTFNSACLAREQVLDEYPDFNLTILDTKAASVGYGLIVHKTAKKINEGYDSKKVIDYANFCIEHMEHIFTVDNLEYLYRGGRVKKSQAVIGNVLNIKPVLEVIDGRLVPLDKAKGRKKVYKKMIDYVSKRGVNLDKQVIGINHGDDIEGAKVLEKMLHEEFGCTEFITNMMGCAIGAHAGPGTLSIFFLNVDEQEKFH